MDDTMLQYKCPCCGGKVEFDSATQHMKCPYCDSEFDVESLKGYDEALREDAPQEEMQWKTHEDNQWGEEEAQNMGVFVCQNCGGEVVADTTTAATQCPYCGSPVVLTGRLAGDLKPDLVIPFKLDKEAAKAALRKHVSGKKLLPRSFKTENHLNEVKGLYVPFWLFDADVDANIRYRGRKVRVWSDSDYNYTETLHFALIRQGGIGFDRVPVDGSSKMPDDLMESIEPFDGSQAVDFQTAYLSGYLADRYDVDAKSSIGRANERIRQSTEDGFRTTTANYANVRTEYSNIHLNNGEAKYALYPVWLLNSTWNGKQYTFAMNGQTGKFVGNLPMDKKQYWKWFGIWSLILSAGVFCILLLLKLIGIL